MTSCKKKSKCAVISISYSLEYASCILHSEKKSKKMGFKKIDSFFSGRLCTEQEGTWTQDFPPDHSSCLAGSRVVRHIRKRCDLQSAFGQSGATPDASFAANWLLKVFGFGKWKNNFCFQKIWHILYETSYMVQRNLLSWRASVISHPLCMCALVLRFVGV